MISLLEIKGFVNPNPSDMLVFEIIQIICKAL
jgi:hypothetical protein